MKKIAI